MTRHEVRPLSVDHPARRAFQAAIDQDRDELFDALSEIESWGEAFVAWIDTMNLVRGMTDYGPHQAQWIQVFDVHVRHEIPRPEQESAVRLASRLIACRLRDDEEGFINIAEGAAEDDHTFAGLVDALLHITATTARVAIESGCLLHGHQLVNGLCQACRGYPT